MKKYLAFMFLLASVVTSSADDNPRKINFLVVLTDADGAPISECTKPDDKSDCPQGKTNVTLGAASMRALVNPERDLPMDESLKRGQLALSVYKSASANLTVEEISLIKKQIAKFYSPLIVVRAFAILDPK